ncbi:hypothetical protein ACOMHN_037941 [Nucella lapillus]
MSRTADVFKEGPPVQDSRHLQRVTPVQDSRRLQRVTPAQDSRRLQRVTPVQDSRRLQRGTPCSGQQTSSERDPCSGQQTSSERDPSSGQQSSSERDPCSGQRVFREGPPVQESRLHGHTTACNHGNSTTCREGNATYEGVKPLASNNNSRSLWMGADNYNASCYGKGRHSVECMNPAPMYTSIITRMRMSTNDDMSSVDQVLKVHYRVSAGSYTGCGSMIQVPQTDKLIDPVHTIYNDGWALEHRPHVTWTASQGDSYTLAFWDSGWFRLHGLWVNINGGRLEDGTEVVSYRGPINPMPRKNAFVFALYRQNMTVDPKAAYDLVVRLMTHDGHLRLDKVVSDLQLLGPVSLSLIRTKADTFNADMGRKHFLINNCPYILTTVMKDHKDKFPWSTDDMHLTVSVDATFHSPPVSFESCCHQHDIPAMKMHVDPRAPTPMEPVYVRQAPRVRLVHTHIKDDPYYFDHASRLFTLLLLDVTESSINVTDKAVVHWQVINIRDPDVTTGNTTLPYLRVKMPMSTPERRYVFLLLEQSQTLTSQQVGAYNGSNCWQHPADRCHFNVSRFMKDLNLTLAGMSMFRTQHDPYSRHALYTQHGVSKPAACAGVTGFRDPCTPTLTATLTPPTCAGVISLPSLLASVLGLLLATLVHF